MSLKLYDQDGLCLGEGRMSPIDSIYKELALCQVLNWGLKVSTQRHHRYLPGYSHLWSYDYSESDYW